MQNKNSQIFSFPIHRVWGHIQRLSKSLLQTLTNWRKWRDGLLLWIILILFLGFIQFSTPDLLDNDGYYHIKLAYLMRTDGLKPDFPWLPLSILNQREFYDHHFLFHVVLIPFTFGDLRSGAKIASILFASLAFLSMWYLLKKQHVTYPSLWAFGLTAVSEAFIYRMSIPRAQSLSLAVLLLGLDALLRKKYRRLAVLSFFYVWLYDAFPLMLVFAGFYVLAAWLLERKLDLKPMIYAAAGIGLGMAINPYFPFNILFTIQHILPKLIETTNVSVGNEWYPYTTAQILQNSPIALTALISGVLALGLQQKRLDLRSLVAFFLVSMFGLMLFQARRFIEYFPPFALLFAVFAWEPLIQQFKLQNQTQPRRNLRSQLPAIVMMVIFLPGSLLTFHTASKGMQTAKPYEYYAGASAWLEDNTPAGERIFQTDWDDFPRLFYYNTHNTYLIGLDPTYMLLYNAELYNLWVDITRGDIQEPSDPILNIFGAQYVLTDLRHRDFIAQAERDAGMVEVYRDEFAIVYRLDSL
jgi:hypothetical protein